MKKLSKKIVAAKLARKAHKLLKSHSVTVIIVTGSVGKTSAKVAIGKLLSGSHQVRFSEDSYNTDIGLPLSIFGLKAPSPLWDPLAWQRVFQKINVISKNYPYDVVVLEMADDELEDMMDFLKFIKPQYGVITGIAPVHMERMGSMDKVVNDNWMIASGAEDIIYNADVKELSKLAKKTKNTIGFGHAGGEIRFSDTKRTDKGYLKSKLTIGKDSAEISTKMIGEQNLNSLLVAAAVAYKMGESFTKISSGLTKITGVNGRMNLLKGVNDSKLIDDSYNSSPDAVFAALDVLADFKANSRIAVLGNMNELGEHTNKSHYEVGKAAAKVSDTLIVIGKDAEVHMVSGATDAGMNPDSIKIFKTPYEAGHFLKRVVKKGDVVLIKGSQNGVFSEEVTRILLDPSQKPEEVLVRQSSTWKRRKRKAFGL